MIKDIQASEQQISYSRQKPAGLVESGDGPRRYRFGFVLTTAAGNMTRYLNLRKYAERDPETECVWAPVSHYMEPNPYSRLPVALQTRLIVMQQARPVMRQMHRLDAVMFHVFEPSVAAALRGLLHRKPLLAWSADNPPTIPVYHFGGQQAHPSWRKKMRFGFDQWLMRRFRCYFPFSQWAADVLVKDCGLPADRIHVINVGLDLELWPCVPKAPQPSSARRQILFVGGDFVRKGGDLLLEVYQKRFADRADLHLVTTGLPGETPPGVKVYADLRPNDARLRKLYEDADLFVLPTRADMSPWVVIEAMATGLPVISTRTGGLSDLVTDGVTGFLVEPEESAGLAERMETLLTRQELRLNMGVEGRARVERDFNAEVCVPRILHQMKQATDEMRGRVSHSGSRKQAA